MTLSEELAELAEVVEQIRQIVWDDDVKTAARVRCIRELLPEDEEEEEEEEEHPANEPGVALGEAAAPGHDLQAPQLG